MIPARKSSAFTAWFAGHARRRIFRNFHAVRVRGLGGVAKAAETAPLLIVSNHTAWWDPLLILYLTTGVLQLDSYAMMDAKNLRRLPFFGRVGAFGVELGDSRDGARAIRYAAKLLDRPGRLLWIFPQGAEAPITRRPLRFLRGSAEVARIARQAIVIPAAIRYEHGGMARPSILVSFGEPRPSDRSRDRKAATDDQEAAVTRELDFIDRALVNEDLTLLTEVYRAKRGWLASTAERALAWLTRAAS